ncbi:DUF1684 domain-containing protein [Kitasatospora sp. NPDC096147]|uniref:DUF1684 domain-containing protein n=1 Tax=Kitasatospora sp. NPDC096147 TaxID=3364093 RepID=UPI00382D3171
MTTDTAAEEWQTWTERRAAAASAPHGTLALTATHWLEPEPAELPGLPGRWWAADGAVHVEASAADGLVVQGSAADSGAGPVDGTRRLTPDTSPGAHLLTLGEVLLVPIEREGELALRVFDPESKGRSSFAGISAFPYSPDWAVPAVFTPFEQDEAVLVENADGRERPLATTGKIAFQLAGEEHTLTVSRAGDQLSGVIADAGSGRESYRFRFITLPAPDADGRTVLDLNRAYLPPCAFADHFICPFPPPGNRLPLVVEAGEKQVLTK